MKRPQQKLTTQILQQIKTTKWDFIPRMQDGSTMTINQYNPL